MALAYPSYASQPIRSALAAMIGPTESIGGAYAPMLTSEAPIRSFYMNGKAINFPYPEHIDRIRPDYLLFSERWDNRVLEALDSNELIQLAEPRHLGTYMGDDLSVIRIQYLNH